MPASTRLFPSLPAAALALLLAMPAADALAGPLYAVAVPDKAGGYVTAIDGSAPLPAAACPVDGGCGTVQPDPPSPLPERGVLATLGFALALILLRGQRPASAPFRAL